MNYEHSLEIWLDDGYLESLKNGILSRLEKCQSNAHTVSPKIIGPPIHDYFIF